MLRQLRVHLVRFQIHGESETFLSLKQNHFKNRLFLSLKQNHFKNRLASFWFQFQQINED
jgi:hypothetical protein